MRNQYKNFGFFANVYKAIVSFAGQLAIAISLTGHEWESTFMRSENRWRAAAAKIGGAAPPAAFRRRLAAPIAAARVVVVVEPAAFTRQPERALPALRSETRRAALREQHVRRVRRAAFAAGTRQRARRRRPLAVVAVLIRVGAGR